MAAKTADAKGSRKQPERSIFNAIRKPAAPPGHPLTQAKPDQKARPAGRKAKHKRHSDLSDLSDEL